jgi:hypothetical protein
MIKAYLIGRADGACRAVDLFLARVNKESAENVLAETTTETGPARAASPTARVPGRERACLARRLADLRDAVFDQRASRGPRAAAQAARFATEYA